MKSSTHVLYSTKISGKSLDFNFLVGIHLKPPTPCGHRNSGATFMGSPWVKNTATACGCQNSATTWPIHSKSSSMELSWPVDVQHHGHLAFGPIRVAHGPKDRLPHLMDTYNSAATRPGIILTPKCVISLSFACQAHGQKYWLTHLVVAISPQPLGWFTAIKFIPR